MRALVTLSSLKSSSVTLPWSKAVATQYCMLNLPWYPFFGLGNLKNCSTLGLVLQVTAATWLTPMLNSARKCSAASILAWVAQQLG